MNVATAVLPVAALLAVGQCERTGFHSNPPELTSFTFAPVDGSWDIQSVNRPPHSIEFGDVERYRVTITGYAEITETRRLQIMADGIKVGIMEIGLTAGEIGSPTFRYRADEGATVTPIGASDLTNGEFWLGCTSPNRHVRGNHGKATGDQSSVSVRLAWAHGVSTAAHQIKCLP